MDVQPSWSMDCLIFPVKTESLLRLGACKNKPEATRIFSFAVQTRNSILRCRTCLHLHALGRLTMRLIHAEEDPVQVNVPLSRRHPPPRSGRGGRAARAAAAAGLRTKAAAGTAAPPSKPRPPAGSRPPGQVPPPGARQAGAGRVVAERGASPCASRCAPQRRVRDREAPCRCFTQGWCGNKESAILRALGEEQGEKQKAKKKKKEREEGRNACDGVSVTPLSRMLRQQPRRGSGRSGGSGLGPTRGRAPATGAR